MKLIALKVFVILTATITASKIFSKSTLSVPKQELVIGFVGDSGYVLQSNLYQLLKISSADTMHIKDSYTKDNDTLGKYYKMASGNYIACVRISGIYGFPAHLIYETLPNGTILKKEQFYSAMNLCCWDNDYNGFEKTGDYVSFRACSSGSAFCSTDLYLFKELVPQEIMESVTTTMFTWTGKGELYKDLTSKLEIHNDTLTVHYKLQYLKLKKKGNKVKKTQNFDLNYVSQNSKWIPTDTITVIDYVFNNLDTSTLKHN